MNTETLELGVEIADMNLIVEHITQKSMIIQQLTADLEECLIQYNIITLYTLLEWRCDLYISEC